MSAAWEQGLMGYWTLLQNGRRGAVHLRFRAHARDDPPTTWLATVGNVTTEHPSRAAAMAWVEHELST